MNTTLEQTLKEIGQRNLERAKTMVSQMGAKHLLHPQNRVTRDTFKQQLNQGKMHVR